MVSECVRHSQSSNYNRNYAVARRAYMFNVVHVDSTLDLHVELDLATTVVDSTLLLLFNMLT